MARHPRRPAELAGKVFFARDAIQRGLLTRNELRSSAWRQLFHNVYADARLAVSHRTRCLAAASWLFPPGCLVAGRSAVALLGGPVPGPDEPVEVLVDPASRFGPLAGLLIHVCRWSEDDVQRIEQVPVTNAVRTCWDLACWLDVVEAVALVDALLHVGVVRLAQLKAYLVRRRGARGVRRFAEVLSLVDGGAGSLPESRLRVRLVRAGLPRPVTQYVIERGNRFIARVDLAWPELKVAVEYDGLWHRDPDQFHRDRQRLNKMLGDDWIVLHVTSKRMKEDFPAVLAEIRTALAARRASCTA
ncbi:endonuclease domain-containing protein [Micromonospora sp. R77]|uniref:endonuclease domain-containing protein n=1 Tax=Micromonospora sp. R77 TaxID=2925836 RepID=UPI001F616AFD|nr:endonuclease domain-containing protein [Micromonospora sp. R77]MCI4065288.1 endonuclease domain-containing protein [Micromonospora sp. R77]